MQSSYGGSGPIEVAARAEYWRVHDWTKTLVDRALGFTAEKLGQLELFEVSA